MPKQQIVSPKLAVPSGHFSHATMIEARGRIVFISGMVAKGADGKVVGPGDIEAQTRQVCENLKAAVEQAGGTLDDICRLDVYVRNMEHFAKIHEVRRAYFKPPAPASTMVEVAKMTSPDWLIEMNAIAVDRVKPPRHGVWRISLACSAGPVGTPVGEPPAGSRLMPNVACCSSPRS